MPATQQQQSAPALPALGTDQPVACHAAAAAAAAGAAGAAALATAAGRTVRFIKKLLLLFQRGSCRLPAALLLRHLDVTSAAAAAAAAAAPLT
jgi:hypothetical protein